MPATVFPVRSRRHQTPRCHTDTKKKKSKTKKRGKKEDKEMQVLTETTNNPCTIMFVILSTQTAHSRWKTQHTGIKRRPVCTETWAEKKNHPKLKLPSIRCSLSFI